MILRLAIVVLGFALGGSISRGADDSQYAAAARDAVARLASAQAELDDATRFAATAHGEAADFQLLMARSLVRAVGQTLLQELQQRRGADAGHPETLTSAERTLVTACLRIEFDAALRHGVILAAEEALLHLRPWLQPAQPAEWARCVESVGRMEYFEEPAVPGGDALASLATQASPTAALLTEAETLARAHPDRLRAQLPLLILYRRLGRGADLDALLSAWQRRAPHAATIPRLARDLATHFSRPPPNS